MTEKSAKGDDWLQGKTAEELDVIEHAGRLLFKDKIRRAKKAGEFEDVPICVRIPRPLEVQDARVEAVRLFKKKGLDRKDDGELFDELDTLCVLARAMRDPAPPHDQFQTVEMLISHEPGKGFDIRSLLDVWERVQLYQAMLDPRITEPTTEEVVAAVYAIDRVRNLSPLAAIAGSALDTCVISMAAMLASYLRHSSNSRPSESSTPEPSPSTSSAPS